MCEGPLTRKRGNMPESRDCSEKAAKLYTRTTIHKNRSGMFKSPFSKSSNTEMDEKMASNPEKTERTITRKVIRVGHSLAVTIAPFLLRREGLHEGSRVNLSVGSTPGILITRKGKDR